jgi:GntR family transcriptional regulator/MocR family aminotransferase
MARAPYVALHVAPTGRRATAADIVASVQREIASGALPAGSRLPPVRALEAQLGLSKNTAQAAYDELVARGLAESREREGVFVLAPSRVAAIAPIAPVPLPQFVAPPLSRNEQAPKEMIALSTVFIDPALLPTERIAECARSVLRERMPAHYDVQGYKPLREAIAKRLDARGLDVAPDDVVITTGSQQSLDIVARSLAVGRIAIETPVYAYAKLLFESLGNELVGLHLDPFAGLDLAQWDRGRAPKPARADMF